MVTRPGKYFFAVILWTVFLSGGCSNDILGLFGSNDISRRWEARNTFNFLKPGDRNISLGDTYSFIVLSDTHIYNNETYGLEKLKNVIDSNVKFAVINGDVTQSGKRKEVKHFIQIAESLGVPCYPVAGNHDIFLRNWPEWEELIGSTCYRIDGGGATLFILDSANAYFGAKQLDWLEKEMKNTAGRVFVFTHSNLFVKSLADGQQFTDTLERARAVSLLKGKCDIMFTGHVHRRIINETDGIQFITTEDFKTNSAYCLVHVSKDGVRWEFKTVPGAQL